MAVERFFIGPPNSGLERNVKSWLIADDAYETLNNAYVWRGQLRKRFGSELLVDGNQRSSRLRAAFTPGGVVVTTPENIAIGQIFSIGSDIFTVTAITIPSPLLSTSSVTATLTAANQVTFSAIAGGTAYWYPALPVMGIITYNTTNINDEFPIAFDTRYAYKRVSSAWERLATGTATWTGDNKDFFWGANYRADTADENILFVTNFVANDGLRFYNDNAITVATVPVVAETWTKAAFVYSASANHAIISAKLIFYFKDRLVLLNLKETAGSATVQNFPNRCRFSQNGSPFETDAWYQAPEKYGKGGYIDAPTEQSIVTAQFLKDKLIVYFERSTYELVYTGNKVLPFVWQKINTELGAESTFSQVPFDDVVLGVGNTGIHACDGASVKRIDDSIPNEVFKVRNENSGLERVAGIREYREEMVYWTFPAEKTGSTISVYPNRVLVYNYKNATWSFNDDSITCFGYWQRGTTQESPIWVNIDTPWSQMEETWGIGAQQLKERFVLAGNQEGFTFFLFGDASTNAEALQVTNFIDTTNTVTCINHNLTDDDYVYFSQMAGVTSLNGNIYPIVVVDLNSFVILQRDYGAGTYTGGGLISRVSNIEIWTKDFNFYNKDGRDISINRIQFYVDKTASGEIMVVPVASDSNIDLTENADGSASNPVLGTSVLETKILATEAFPNASRVWRSVFFNANGQSIQFRFFFSNDQIKDPEISRVDFRLNAMLVYAERTSTR